jgi:hypothetical protein
MLPGYPNCLTDRNLGVEPLTTVCVGEGFVEWKVNSVVSCSYNVANETSLRAGRLINLNRIHE